MAFTALGCSSSRSGLGASDGGCPPAYFSDADLSTPTSFAVEVLPVFAANCAVNQGRCHGASANYPFLGSPDGGVDAAIILENVVGVVSGEDPKMNFVEQQNPGKSYLMHKMDGDQCTLASECALSPNDSEFPNCGHSMPFSGSILSPSTRDQVRAWIKQGALNN